MILRNVMVPGKELQCECCQRIWVSTDQGLPDCCPNRECRSRQWNGPKKRAKAIELPKPTKVRQQGEGEDYGF